MTNDTLLCNQMALYDSILPPLDPLENTCG
jgi:hypothetical protein